MQFQIDGVEQHALAARDSQLFGDQDWPPAIHDDLDC